MSFYTFETYNSKKFHLLSELKRLAEKRAEKLVKDYKASIRTKASKQAKWAAKTANEIFKYSRKNFITKYMVADNIIDRTQVLANSLIGVYTGSFLIEDIGETVESFIAECETEYAVQARYYIESRFKSFDAFNSDYLDNTLLILRETGDEKADEYFSLAPIINELYQINLKITGILSDKAHQYSSEEFAHIFTVYLTYIQPELNSELKPLFDSVMAKTQEYFFKLSSKLDTKIIAQESLKRSSATILINLMNEYHQLELDFGSIISLAVSDKYEIKRKKLVSSLDELSTSESIVKESLQTLNTLTDNIEIVLAANAEIENISNLIYALDSRYLEFQEFATNLVTWKKSCSKLINDTLGKLLDISLKIPVDYTGLKPENQFAHWREKIEKLDSYLITFASVDKAIRVVNKARMKLIMSGESYSIDLCRRYPKKTGSIKHHLEQYYAVINGLTGISGTERVLGELEQQAEALQSVYFEFMLDVKTINEIIARVKSTKIKLCEIPEQDIYLLVEFIEKYNEHTILIYPELEALWIPVFKFVELNQTAILTIIEGTE